MDDLDPRPRKQSTFYGSKGPAFAVGDQVRARQGKTVHYWTAKVLSIEPEYMLVEWTGEYETMMTTRVQNEDVKRPGADDEYASGADGGSGASSSQAATTPRKKTKQAHKDHDWSLHEITAMRVEQANGLDDRSSIPSRT